MTDATLDASKPLPAPTILERIAPISIAGMLLLAVLWGLSIPITKLGLADMPPIAFTALRFAFATPFLFLFAIGRHRIPLSALPKVAALGVVGIGIGNLSQSFGVAGASASVSTIVSATIPVFIVILAALRLGQPVSRVQQLGLAAAFAGVALVALDQGNGTDGQTTWAGVALVLLSAVTIAFYYVWSVELAARHGTITVVIWSTLAGFLSLVPFAGWEVTTTPFSVTPTAVLSALYLGLLVSATGLFLWLWLLRTVPARVAASVQFLQPVFGIGASAVMFGDLMGPLFAAGVVLVLIGVALSVTSRRPGIPWRRRRGTTAAG